MNTALNVMSPSIQYAFAGFAFMLVGVIVWLITRLLKILQDTNGVIAANTQAISAVHTTADTTEKLCADIRDQLLSRPCLVPRSDRA